jgi:hypothetical protein
MRSEKEIKVRLEKLRVLENTPIDRLRIQRYHEINLLEWVLNPAVATSIKEAKKHHRKHGDMDGRICLLNECVLHYPKQREEMEEE